MQANKERVGAFTSSNIYRLMTNGSGEGGVGVPFLSYVKEKRLERLLGRSIEMGGYSQSTAWGNFMEMFVFSRIGIEYQITSQTTDVHPTIKGWAGSKDLIVSGVKVGDIKCYEPKNFALYALCLHQQDTDIMKRDFPKEYWQLVSNAIINEVPKAEALLYMPYQKELPEIRDFAASYEGADAWKYRFIYEKDDELLPYLPDNNKKFKDLERFEFVVPDADKEALTNRVKMAIKMLLK